MVAIKTAKEAQGEGADDMVKEATVMSQVKPHPNLVSLIGVVTSGLPLLLLISMCEHGSVQSLLQDRAVAAKAKQCAPLSFAERAKICLETARGMAYLIASRFIHRDLAARNVLMDSTFQAKIADFGLARGIASAKAGPKQGDEEEDYYRSQNGVFPVRWCAPESMQTMRFSEASDVWSFGIVCLEVYSDGEKPYTGMDNAAVINKVQAGYRAPKPPACNAEFYAVMLACWMEKPRSRPSFSAIADIMNNMVPKGTRIQPINYKAEATRAFSNPSYQGGTANPIFDSSSDESLDDYVDLTGHADVAVNQEAHSRARRQSSIKGDEHAAAAAQVVADFEGKRKSAAAAAKKKKKKKEAGGAAGGRKKPKKPSMKKTSASTEAVGDGGYMTVATKKTTTTMTSTEGVGDGGYTTVATGAAQTKKKKKVGSTKQQAKKKAQAASADDDFEEETSFGFANEE